VVAELFERLVQDSSLREVFAVGEARQVPDPREFFVSLDKLRMLSSSALLLLEIVQIQIHLHCDPNPKLHNQSC
jgi:hypothetical protein